MANVHTDDPIVVFGDDESPGADVAWLWLTEQPWPGWTVKVVTAKPEPTDHLAAPEERVLGPWDPPHPRPMFAESAAEGVEFLAAVGDPRDLLGQVPCRLLVVGPRGGGLLKSLHIGSTAEGLIHTLPAPVLIARHGRPVRRVLVCADGSADSDAAVAALAGMPWLGSCDVTVLSVPEPDCDPEAAVAAAAGRLGDAAATIAEQVARPDQMDVFFHVRDVIFNAIERIDADLVVHGSRGLSDLQSLQVGSIASSLARHAPCSTLMAKAEVEAGSEDGADQ